MCRKLGSRLFLGALIFANCPCNQRANRRTTNVHIRLYMFMLHICGETQHTTRVSSRRLHRRPRFRSLRLAADLCLINGGRVYEAPHRGMIDSYMYIYRRHPYVTPRPRWLSSRLLFHLGAFYHLSVRLVTAISRRNEFLSVDGLSSN